ncbi:hypothetical protein EJB05_56470, partial [Eragrostis curvula]
QIQKFKVQGGFVLEVFTMAAQKLLCFAALISFVILASGSRSPADMEAVVAPLQGSMGVSYDCVYTIYVQTGSIWKAGTDAVIGLTLRGTDGYGFKIKNLARWGGLMGAGYDYYERGNVDLFSGRAPCLASPPCRMNLTSDGSGDHHGWYCKTVEVTTTRQHSNCFKSYFGVEQWLARDAPPYELYAERSFCDKSKGGDAEDHFNEQLKAVHRRAAVAGVGDSANCKLRKDKRMLELPVIDLRLAGSRPEESARLLDAARRLGCFRVTGHGVPRALQADMKAAARALHELPGDTKRRNADVIPGSGYRAPSARNPLFESLGVYDAAASGNLDAFCGLLDAPANIRYHIIPRSRTAVYTLYLARTYAAVDLRCWFRRARRDTITAYTGKVHELVADVAAKLAASLGVAEEDSVPSFRDWPCQFRVNKYNYTPETVGSHGVDAHTDPSFAAVILEDDSIGGFEVEHTATGEFALVDAPVPGSLLINMGDIATAWSNGVLHNVRHRVRCVGVVPRFSIVMFLLS